MSWANFTEDVPAELQPLSRRLEDLLLHNELQWPMDHSGWVRLEHVLDATPEWSRQDVRWVLSLSVGPLGKRFEESSQPDGQIFVRAAQRQPWQPPPRRRPTPPELRMPARPRSPRTPPPQPPTPRRLTTVPPPQPRATEFFDISGGDDGAASPAEDGAAASVVADWSAAAASVPDDHAVSLAASFVAAPSTPPMPPPTVPATRRSCSSTYRMWQALPNGQGGLTWVCEEDQTERFDDANPAPWTLYRVSPNEQQLYWYNADTEEWFYW